MIKNVGPRRLGAGRLLGFLGAGDARIERAAAGVGGAVGGSQGAGAMVCRWWPSGLPAWRRCGPPAAAGGLPWMAGGGQ